MVSRSRNLTRNFALLFVVLLLQGCAASHYKPGAGGESGYYERMIHEDYYEVSYLGNKDVSHKIAYDFAVLRTLEIGRGLGYEFMLVDSAQDSSSP